MLLTDELVEKCARAICNEHGILPDMEIGTSDDDAETAWRLYRDHARAALSIAAREITEACAKVALNCPLEAGRGNVRKSRLSYQEIQFQIASAIRALAREVA
jgi:hypothetical protein